MNDLARVARATNQAEAEFVQALLLEAGIPVDACGARPGSTCPTCSPPARATSWSRRRPHDAARDVLLRAEIVNRRLRGRGPTHARAARRPARSGQLLEAMRIYPPGGGP